MILVPKRLAAWILVANAVLAAVLAYRLSHSYFWLSRRFRPLIEQAARKHGVDPHLVAAVIWHESRFRPREVGSRGEIGLMQITDGAAREWAYTFAVSGLTRRALFDPTTNIEIGTWYLARALSRWSHCSDPLPYALAEYNAGNSVVRRWYGQSGPDAEQFIRTISYPTTRRYVTNIIHDYRRRKGEKL